MTILKINSAGVSEQGRFARRIVSREDSVRSTHSQYDGGKSWWWWWSWWWRSWWSWIKSHSWWIVLSFSNENENEMRCFWMTIMMILNFSSSQRNSVFWNATKKNAWQRRVSNTHFAHFVLPIPTSWTTCIGLLWKRQTATVGNEQGQGRCWD